MADNLINNGPITNLTPVNPVKPVSKEIAVKKAIAELWKAFEPELTPSNPFASINVSKEIDTIRKQNEMYAKFTATPTGNNLHLMG